MRGSLSRRSVQAAYQSLMDEPPPSKTSMKLERTRREWIWEFVLSHCSDLALGKALVEAYPIPDGSLRLKRMVLLKSLSFELAEDSISERTVETIAALMELSKSDGRAGDFQMAKDGFISRILGRGSAVADETMNCENVCLSLKDLHLAVRLEYTIQYLRKEVDNWPKFCQAVEKHWGDHVEDTEDQEEGDGKSPSSSELQLKKELWCVRKKPKFRHALLGKCKRPSVKHMLNSFLEEAWRDLGPTFLEGVAENLSKRLYVQVDAVPQKETDVSIIKNRRELVEEETEVALLASKTFGKQQPAKQLPQVQKKNSSNTIQDLEEERAKVLAGGRKKVQESMQMGRGNNILSTSTEAQPSVEPKQQSPEPRSTENHNNLLAGGNGTKTDELSSEQTLQNSGRVKDIVGSGSSSKAAEMASRAEDVPGDENLYKGTPTEDAAVARSLSPQGDVPTYLSPPPWAGSPGLNSHGLSVSSRKKRQKLGSLFLDNKEPSELVKSTRSFQENAVLDTPEISKAQFELKEGQSHLNAVVKDPLPEALRIAEEAAKAIEMVAPSPNINRAEEKFLVDGTDQHTMGRVLHHGIAIHHISPEKKFHRSLMDRNPTAQTFEWDTNDEIADSADDQSPSSSRQIRLPELRPRQGFSPLGRKVAHIEPQRRKMKRWTQEEENILKKEVARYGKGHWKYILQKNSEVFENRTEVDLKDKWRNIERREGIL